LPPEKGGFPEKLIFLRLRRHPDRLTRTDPICHFRFPPSSGKSGPGLFVATWSTAKRLRPCNNFKANIYLPSAEMLILMLVNALYRP